MWGYGSPTVARDGQRVFAAEPETGEGVKPLCHDALPLAPESGAQPKRGVFGKEGGRGRKPFLPERASSPVAGHGLASTSRFAVQKRALTSSWRKLGFSKSAGPPSEV